jgi:hypothetical protein
VSQPESVVTPLIAPGPSLPERGIREEVAERIVFIFIPE